jgi:hypothetical protein
LLELGTRQQPPLDPRNGGPADLLLRPVVADNAAMEGIFISIVCYGVASLFATLLIRAAIRVFK